MKKIFVILILSFILFGCSNTSKIDYKKIMKENEYIILDVRTKEEYDELHIKDSVNMPYDSIDNDITLDKDKIIFVYCKSGNRSKTAYDTLTNLGYKVYDLGGITSIDLPIE